MQLVLGKMRGAPLPRRECILRLHMCSGKLRTAVPISHAPTARIIGYLRRSGCAEKEAKRQATEGGASPSATDGGAEKKEGGAGAASSETGGHTEGADAAGSQPPAAVGTGSAASETKKSEAEEDAATRR